MTTLSKAKLAKQEIDRMKTADMAAGLEYLLHVQSFVSNLVPDAASSPPTNDQIVRAAFALNAELHEVVDELGWKSWKENPVIDEQQRENIAEEMADVMAFLGLFLWLVELRSGVSPDMIAAAYKNKSHKNVARFIGESDEPGYNGLMEASDE